MSNLEHLLFCGESETLDFKRDQYPFEGADDNSKSELLKDILAMANAWRSTPARILVGVDAPVGGRSVAVGVTKHPDDAALQQFVNSKTTRPVRFSYYTVELWEKSIGVIEVPVQRRPVFLKKNFGKLKANVVYLRRGSSTVEALPEEIAQMGSSDQLIGGRDLQVRFAAPKGRKILGTEIKIESTVIHVDNDKPISDFTDEPRGLYGISLRRANPDFYRELVRNCYDAKFFNHAAFTLTNLGSVFAKETRVEIEAEDQYRVWEFADLAEHDFQLPQRYVDLFYHSHAGIQLPETGDADIEIDYSHGRWYLALNGGKLQPGRTLWPSLDFLVGARRSGKLVLGGRILADGLPEPTTFELQIVATAEDEHVTLRALEDHYLTEALKDMEEGNGEIVSNDPSD